MVHDAWLPVGFLLHDGSRTKTVLHEGINWQIVGTHDGGQALVARRVLAQRWIDVGLIEPERFQPLVFGPGDYLAVTFAAGHLVAPVNDCRSPNNKGEAFAFAAAFKATRDIDADSPLQDAIYVEPWSRLLPTYAISIGTDDAVVLGYWLTGGAPISATSSRRLQQTLTWMRPQDLRQVVTAAGFTAADDDIPDACAVAEDGGAASAAAALIGRKEPFCLPGRPTLEAFLLEHVIDIIENRARYKSLGIGFPSAIVLHGPPGCGKTFAVDRLLEHLGWPGFHIDASSVASPYIHETSRKISQMFDTAEKSAPSVLVIDEMDAFLSERDTGTGQHRVEEVAEFLRRIPGAVAKDVLIIAMTNRLDMIDPAILRRGRFDHVIEVGPASETEVEALISALLAKLPANDDIDVPLLAKKLAGRPLSDVAFVVREGARLAARSGQGRISQANLLSAVKATPDRERGSERRIGFM